MRFPFTCHDTFSGWSPSASHRIVMRSLRRTEICFWCVRTFGPTAWTNRTVIFPFQSFISRNISTYRAPSIESICSVQHRFHFWPGTGSSLHGIGWHSEWLTFRLDMFRCCLLSRILNHGIRRMGRQSLVSTILSVLVSHPPHTILSLCCPTQHFDLLVRQSILVVLRSTKQNSLPQLDFGSCIRYADACKWEKTMQWKWHMRKSTLHATCSQLNEEILWFSSRHAFTFRIPNIKLILYTVLADVECKYEEDSASAGASSCGRIMNIIWYYAPSPMRANASIHSKVQKSVDTKAKCATPPSSFVIRWKGGNSFVPLTTDKWIMNWNSYAMHFVRLIVLVLGSRYT